MNLEIDVISKMGVALSLNPNFKDDQAQKFLLELIPSDSSMRDTFMEGFFKCVVKRMTNQELAKLMYDIVRQKSTQVITVVTQTPATEEKTPAKPTEPTAKPAAQYVAKPAAAKAKPTKPAPLPPKAFAYAAAAAGIGPNGISPPVRATSPEMQHTSKPRIPYGFEVESVDGRTLCKMNGDFIAYGYGTPMNPTNVGLPYAWCAYTANVLNGGIHLRKKGGPYPSTVELANIPLPNGTYALIYAPVGWTMATEVSNTGAHYALYMPKITDFGYGFCVYPSAGGGVKWFPVAVEEVESDRKNRRLFKCTPVSVLDRGLIDAVSPALEQKTVNILIAKAAGDKDPCPPFQVKRDGKYASDLLFELVQRKWSDETNDDGVNGVEANADGVNGDETQDGDAENAVEDSDNEAPNN